MTMGDRVAVIKVERTTLARASGDSVLLGFRPEDLELGADTFVYGAALGLHGTDGERRGDGHDRGHRHAERRLADRGLTGGRLGRYQPPSARRL